MKFKDLDGNFHSKDISKYKWLGGGLSSLGERELGERLRTLFPNLVLYTQLPCVGTRLRLDFYINDLKLAFEFDGEQHENYVPHFHGTKRKFQMAKQRDREKEQWCDVNQIRLIRVNAKYLDSLEEFISDK